MRHIAHTGCFGRVFRVFARKHLPVWGDNFLAADARLFDVVARGMDFPAGVVIQTSAAMHALQAAIVFILHFVLFDMSIR